ncbi:DNL zinc finger protein [Besnoitia besnoiti]|uniref:DNL zinc finger protein n=1 Tax=Besnoitia besnoiti TaxID=94643 RepID=A0A2A9MD85_BESBE|nr:DNL zinc finger protein [Besnoitia besnoiti]PFH33340.1 DNL zinc finger protein [Besnoitia besnoiti]
MALPVAFAVFPLRRALLSASHSSPASAFFLSWSVFCCNTASTVATSRSRRAPRPASSSFASRLSVTSHPSPAASSCISSGVSWRQPTLGLPGARISASPSVGPRGSPSASQRYALAARCRASSTLSSSSSSSSPCASLEATSEQESAGGLNVKIDVSKVLGTGAKKSQDGAEASPPSDLYVLLFTCKPCGTRSAKKFSKRAYHNGVVVIKCPHCASLHLIADNFGWFGESPQTIEDILKEKGEKLLTALTAEDLLDLSDLKASAAGEGERRIDSSETKEP